jgi:hypothetical protein
LDLTLTGATAVADMFRSAAVTAAAESDFPPLEEPPLLRSLRRAANEQDSRE